MPEDRLVTGLRAAATALDAAAPPITADGLPAGARGPDRRPVLLALVASFVVVVGVMALLLARGTGDDDDSRVVTPVPGPTSTTTAPVRLPAMGFAVVDDGLWSLFDPRGQPLGTASAPDDYYLGDGRLVLSPEGDRLELPPPDGTEVPDGCESAAAGGGVRVAVCGIEEGRYRRLDVVRSDGTATPLTDAPPDPGAQMIIGSWRFALVSPDGRWVLGQWSAECESRTAFVLATDGTGELRTVTGETGADWLGSSESVALGWAPDGRALIEIPGMDCGGPLADAGVYLLDPATGDRELVRAAVVPEGELFSTEDAYAWTLAES